jgi:hypothetical protein
MSLQTFSEQKSQIPIKNGSEKIAEILLEKMQWARDLPA